MARDFSWLIFNCFAFGLAVSIPGREGGPLFKLAWLLLHALIVVGLGWSLARRWLRS